MCATNAAVFATRSKPIRRDLFLTTVVDEQTTPHENTLDALEEVK